MAERPPERPPGAAVDRRRRLAEAMRANLKRRKAQQRERDAQPAVDAAEEPVEEA
jgi:hypothetical protein